MSKMKREYAEKLLEDEGYAFYLYYFSCHDDLLVCLDTFEDGFSFNNDDKYVGTQLNDGKFMVDSKGYVVFFPVKPVVDENTRFEFK